MLHQAKAGLDVVLEGRIAESRWCPTIRRVTGFTGGVEQPRVNGGFGVTGNTLRGKFIKLVIQVTSCTIGCSMLAFEWEFCLAVVEIGHAIHTVMTGQAVEAKFLLVLRHERSVVSGVASGAGFLCDAEVVCGVATGTWQEGGVVVYLVPDQAEGGHGMIEVFQPGAGGVKIPSAVVGVAGEAGGFGIQLSV